MRSINIGVETYGEVCLAYLKEAGVEVVGFVDDDQKYVGKTVRNIPVIGTTSELVKLRERYKLEEVYCPLGNINCV